MAERAGDERAGERVTVHEAREGVASTRVAAAVAATGPICAGIDPSSSLLTTWGLPDTGDGLLEFGLRCVDAFAGVVPVIKPQVAFFRAFGGGRHGRGGVGDPPGASRRVGGYCRRQARRHRSTLTTYASAWLDPDSPLASDAMTAVAYMGPAALQPMIDLAGADGNGVFVVARSSNPEGRALQQITGDDGQSVADGLLAEIAARNASAPGIIGAVVGATLQPSGFSLSESGGPILAPGVGTQGATAQDVGALFKGCPAGSILPGVSRSVLAAGPDVGGLRSRGRRAARHNGRGVGYLMDGPMRHAFQ